MWRKPSKQNSVCYITVCTLLMMDKNNTNKVITDRNNGAVKYFYMGSFLSPQKHSDVTPLAISSM